MAEIRPNRFNSVQEFLAALGFQANGECFVRGNITFPVTEVIGYTPASFHNKMKARGWLTESADASAALSIWGHQFMSGADLILYTGEGKLMVMTGLFGDE